MTEQHGRYDRRPSPRRSPQGEPEPLGELLRRYVEDRHWEHLLAPPHTNGHQPPDPTTDRRRDG